ncbi:MAG: response regulator transcription factor [Acetobacterium sp.]|nr:response regulator transcription factor [Bacillota bacterium]MCG2730971.1 response regulator transcription factor [Acetobacterium sp.]
MYKILIVEDDQIIATSLKNHLDKWGLEAAAIGDFHHILDEFVTYDPQLVLLDISLPFFNGYHWCSEIRKISKVPIIFISSTSDNMNIVMAMNMGGDDFIAKPFDLAVVVAKIQALLRRTYSFQGQVNLLEHKGAILNLGDASISYNDQKLELSKNEFKTLQILLENKGKVVSRDVIMKRLWDSDCFVDDNTLTVNIARLRKKLDEAGLTDFIATKKGIGYLIGD